MKKQGRVSYSWTYSVVYSKQLLIERMTFLLEQDKAITSLQTGIVITRLINVTMST
jgi:hypothetical protein